MLKNSDNPLTSNTSRKSRETASNSAQKDNKMVPKTYRLTQQDINNLENSPLAPSHQWCVWQYGPPRTEGGKPQKIPSISFTGNRFHKGTPVLPNLSPLKNARERFEADPKLAGVGFVMIGDQGKPLVCIDLDNCRDVQTGAVEPWAKTILDRFPTYTEVSPSGAGFHIWINARVPFDCKQTKGIEVYYGGNRFMTMTGQHLVDTPIHTVCLQDDLDEFIAQTFTNTVRTKSNGEDKTDHAAHRSISDEELLEKARNGKHGAEFVALFDRGEIFDGKSESESDFSLCRQLAFWTGCDAERIDMLFRKSALYDDAWERKGAITIENAIKACKTTYTPRSSRATPNGSSNGENGSRANIGGDTATEQKTVKAKAKPQPKKNDAERLTDVGNAKRLVRHFGDYILYSHERKCWYLWKGGRWQQDIKGQITMLAERTVARIYAEASGLGADSDARKAIAKHAIRSESDQRIKAMCSLARHRRAVDVIDLDSNIHLVGCLNGTIDTRTGEFRKPRREDLITKSLGCEFDPEAKCPTWDKFMVDVMCGDAEKARFVQKAVGYSLTGEVKEQCLFFLYGNGRNGKSTFINAVKKLYGDYVVKIPTSALMNTKDDKNQQELARLPGRRIAIANETDSAGRLNEPLVKDMTGGDPLPGRELYSATFEFDPQHKLWLYGNYKPNIHGTDEGIWRRIRLIPFTQEFSPGNCDPGLPGKLIAELPGILNWALEGCRAWREEGLPVPESISESTQEYRSEMDSLGAFIDEACSTGPRLTGAIGLLFEHYTRWCDDSGERFRYTRREFVNQLLRRGYTRCRVGEARTRSLRGIDVEKYAVNSYQTKTTNTDATDATASFLKSPIRERYRKKTFANERPFASVASFSPNQTSKKHVKCKHCANYVRSAKNSNEGQCVLKKIEEGPFVGDELRVCELYEKNSHSKADQPHHSNEEIRK